MKKIRLVLVGVIAALTSACTPQQIADWVAWNERDPAAAQEFANQPWVQELLARPAQQARPASAQRTGQGGGVWDRLAWCESGGNWGYNGGSGYDGGLQFLPATWNSYGGREFASHAWGASREQQIIVAERVLADVGWRAWPACSRKLGLR